MRRDDTAAALRRDLIDFAHRLHRSGLLVAFDGNLSVRRANGSFICTRANCHKGLLTDDDLVELDASGAWRAGLGQPTSEIAMHLACYRVRPDVHAVIHAHPPAAIACTLAGLSLDRPVLPEVVLTLGTVPTLPYRTTGTADLASQVGHAVRRRSAVLLARHGAVTLGASLLHAFAHLETVEQAARISLDAARHGPIEALPRSEAVALRRAGLRRYGGPPESLELIDAPYVDLDYA